MNRFYFDTAESLTFDKQFLAHEIVVHYNDTLDGGGSSFGQDYRHVLSSLYPDRVFENCFEWCAGPALIGFDLLSRGYCKRLYANDIYKPALESIQCTVQNNLDACKDRVFTHHCQGIQELPPHWKFDLVVSNPPHWNTWSDQMITKISYKDRICCDENWNLHREFFSHIKNYLNPDAIILLQEHAYASGPDTFKHMIEQNGMFINDCYWQKKGEQPRIWYLEVKVQS